MAKNRTYTGKDIVALSDRDHVRLRTAVYLGNTHPTVYRVPVLSANKLTVKDVEFIPAVYKAIGEIIDNALDEFAQINSKIKLLKINAEPKQGWYCISDNGRGIPIDKHESGKYTPEVALGALRAGRNFTDEKEIGVIGANGVGAAATAFCSTDFEAIIRRDGKKYRQRFTDGAKKISKPSITHISSQKTGTQISFQLDKSVFKDVSLPEQLMRNRAIEIAMTNPDVTCEYNGERYRYKKGMQDIVKQIAKDQPFYCFTIKEPNITGEFYIIVNAHNEIDEQIYTWVNSSLLFDGGKCNTQFFNAFFDCAIEHLKKDAKKAQCEVTRNDIRQGLLVLANIKMKNPEYDSQAKTRLTGPDLRKEIAGMVDAQWKPFAKKSQDWLNQVLEDAAARHHMQENKKAIDEHQKTFHKRVKGLLDATSRTRSECQLLIAEGASAKSQVCEAREPETTGAYELGGKINNVYGSTPAQVLKMEKVTNLLLAIGLTPGKKAVRSNLNYGRIVIATDADYDGSDIFTLLVNLFYQFWPELFSAQYEPIIYRLIAPNVVVIKGKQRVHFSSRDQYEKHKDKYKGCTIEYMKGLGSMSLEDWKMILSGKTDTMIPVVDDGKIKDTLKLLFDDNADARKYWLTSTDK